MFEMLRREELLTLIGMTVRFNLDSKAAVSNLVRAGPVRELLPLVKQIWYLFEEKKITPVFRWVPRRDSPMRRVDELSKKVTFKLKPESLTLFENKFGCVDHNKLAEVLAGVVVRGIQCAVLVPRWEGKSWWSVLVTHAKDIVSVAKQHVLFLGGDVVPSWEFVFGLF
jgi:hypothetical protein